MRKTDEQLSLELPVPEPQATVAAPPSFEPATPVVSLAEIREARVIAAIEERVRRAAVFAL